MEELSSSETLVSYLPNYNASYPKILILDNLLSWGPQISRHGTFFRKILHSAYLSYYQNTNISIWKRFTNFQVFLDFHFTALNFRTAMIPNVVLLHSDHMIIILQMVNH